MFNYHLSSNTNIGCRRDTKPSRVPLSNPPYCINVSAISRVQSLPAALYNLSIRSCRSVRRQDWQGLANKSKLDELWLIYYSRGKFRDVIGLEEGTAPFPNRTLEKSLVCSGLRKDRLHSQSGSCVGPQRCHLRQAFQHNIKIVSLPSNAVLRASRMTSALPRVQVFTATGQRRLKHPHSFEIPVDLEDHGHSCIKRLAIDPLPASLNWISNMDDEFVEVNTTRGKLLISQSLLPSTPEELERIYPERVEALNDRHGHSIQSTRRYRGLANDRDTEPWPVATSGSIPTQSQTNGLFLLSVSSPQCGLAPPADSTHTDKPTAKSLR